MVVAVWSVKGGVGVTSVAAMLAMAQVERAQETLLVDLCGDVATVLGVDEHLPGPGIAEWCAMDRPDPDALARVEVEVRPGLRFVPRGVGGFSGDATNLLQVLATSRRDVIIDCGALNDRAEFRRNVVQLTPTTLMVMRECFLNLRAAQRTELVPSGVVVIKEARRQLGRLDVETATKAPVVAEVAFDAAISRSIDVGLARARLPRMLLRRLGGVMTDAA